MKPKDGRKALVVFSDGADRGSKETLNDAMDAAERANVSIYTIYFKGEQERQRTAAFPAAVGVAEWVAAGPVAVAAIRAAVAAIREVADGEAGVRLKWTARRLWRRLPRAPAAGFSMPRRRKTWKRSTD